MKRNALLLGLLMGGTVLNSAALTIGRIRGAAWIGQPLSLSVPVQIDTASTDTALCAEADVYYADALKDPARIQVQQTPGPQGNIQMVQIVSAVTIDEPMVTVYLRVGCGQKVSRRYVLLADFPSVPASSDAGAAVVDAVATSAAVDAPNPVEASPLDAATPSPLVSTAATPAESPAPTRVKAPSTRKVARSAPAPQRTGPKQAAAQAKPAAQAAPGKPAAEPVLPPANPPRARLKLDPLENLSERIKTLETTTTAIPLEDMVRDAQRIQQLQADVKKLLDQTAKNEATLAQMRERLQQAEAQRVSSTLVYALAALVLACLAAIAVLWNRRSTGAVVNHRWSAARQDDDDEPAPVVHHTAPTPAPVATMPAPVVAPMQSESASGVDLLEMDVDADSYDKLIHPAPTQSAKVADVALPDSAPVPMLDATLAARDFNSDSQLDLCQQAEFFDRLGKTDEAIEILEKRIRANGKDCPLIYLQLLRIANTRSLKTDFRQFRDECMQAFNVAVPEFALFRSEGRALNTYPDLLAHIEKLWNTPRVLEVLDSCIVRDPWEKNAKPFDLAAFKELVVLHGRASRSEPMASPANQPAQAGTKVDNPESLGIDLEL